MIRVLFFARIREQLGTDRVDVSAEHAGSSIAELRDSLIAAHGAAWAEPLMQGNVITALNQEVVALDALVSDGDELAFFPPVTGG